MTITSYGTGRATVGITEYLAKYLNDLTAGQMAYWNDNQPALMRLGSFCLATGQVLHSFDPTIPYQFPNEAFAVEQDDTLDVGALSVYHVVRITIAGLQASSQGLGPVKCVMAEGWGSEDVLPFHDWVQTADLPYMFHVEEPNNSFLPCGAFTMWQIMFRDCWVLTMRPTLQKGERQELGPEFCIGLLSSQDGDGWTPEFAMGQLAAQAGVVPSLLRNEYQGTDFGPFLFKRGLI